ncbi:uncharacterized protein LOC122039897 [Zingiber officinale]|uniref:DUF7950 domain-containing protein n=1 Tax=Zingiber officinale TaxID=94328 RepID=A0A8J5I2H3_ZINOF|nr:uncharacterized protein LOC122039897 [Zingiber officinale]KAG6528832.1 hypothetical protein ZIOFF_011017 [Zingiber officinale]
MLDPVHTAMAKTHEILARFRPIAPRPSHPPPLPPDAPSPTENAASSSFYRCVPRPCRSRKRGRGHLGAPSNKRQRTIFPLLPAAVPPSSYNRPAPAVPFPRVEPEKSADELLTLCLRPRSFDDGAPPLVEQDLLQKLQDQPKVIAPQPLRPVGSSISVTRISRRVEAETAPAPLARRREEVEAEVESDALPAVVSDWRNRVRLVNSAYREMVGQPECPWIDAMVMGVDVGRGPAATRRRPRRISGEVMLDVEESAMPKTAAGFSCRARIEWACNGRKNCVTAPCSVIRLFCESNDYLLAWRFDTCKAAAAAGEAEHDDDCTSPASVLVASIGMYN